MERLRDLSKKNPAADSRTNTNFERLRDLSRKKREKKNGAVDASISEHPPFFGLHARAMDALHPPPVFRAPRV